MLPSQLSLFPQDSALIEKLQKEFAPLKSLIVPHCQYAATSTLRMSYLDPDYTTPQIIGTYLHDNLISRLFDTYNANDSQYLKSYFKKQKFQLCYTSPSSIDYHMSIHRCGSKNFVPKGAHGLKKKVQLSYSQPYLLSLPDIKQSQKGHLGLFVGIVFQENKGLIEIFLGQLTWSSVKRRYSTNKLSVLYRTGLNKIDTSKYTAHSYEEIAEAEVKFNKRQI
ncbi:MAG: hypothetical protein HDQ89_11035 [Desulfovibrio sp.]|nr:hypothetical protein [Desulfovibrio sp.]